MYILKQQPEDFCVTEINNIILKEEGEYAYFLLTKVNYETLKAIQKIASALKIPLKNIGYAGTKDKKAITQQVCSAKNVNQKSIERVFIQNIHLDYLGRDNKPIALGDHLGNKFKIIVRNITKIPEVKEKFINYFGEQRLSRNNAIIGKLIIQKKFRQATEQISQFVVKTHLENNMTDYVGALRKIPIKLLKMYVHAYQSLLWNKMAEKNPHIEKLPVIGFATKETEETKTVLAEEGITIRDFIIKQIPEISSEGTERKVLAQVKELKISKLENDDLNPGMKKITLEFSLDKGSYATEFIRQSFS